MGIDWDRHLLIPLEKTFAERVNWRPRHGNGAYDISGIFDRAYLQDVIAAEGDDPRLNTTRPVLGSVMPCSRSRHNKATNYFYTVIAVCGWCPMYSLTAMVGQNFSSIGLGHHERILCPFAGGVVFEREYARRRARLFPQRLADPFIGLSGIAGTNSL